MTGILYILLKSLCLNFMFRCTYWYLHRPSQNFFWRRGPVPEKNIQFTFDFENCVMKVIFKISESTCSYFTGKIEIIW